MPRPTQRDACCACPGRIQSATLRCNDADIDTGYWNLERRKRAWATEDISGVFTDRTGSCLLPSSILPRAQAACSPTHSHTLVPTHLPTEFFVAGVAAGMRHRNNPLLPRRNRQFPHASQAIKLCGKQPPHLCSALETSRARLGGSAAGIGHPPQGERGQHPPSTDAAHPPIRPSHGR